jgi:hypothetical protein
MIPLAYLLIPYGIFVAAVLVHGFLTMWALYRFGGEFSAFCATFLFWAASLGVLFFTWTLLTPVDWSQPLLQFSVFAPTGF